MILMGPIILTADFLTVVHSIFTLGNQVFISIVAPINSYKKTVTGRFKLN